MNIENNISCLRKLALTVMAVLMTLAASAQMRISGTVVDENNLPAIGVNIVVGGSTTGTATDLDGKYVISANKGDILSFSYLGYQTQNVKVGSQTTIDVTLVLDSNMMEELVVVGYTTVKRSDLTGSVSSVSAKSVEGFKTGTVIEALGGQIAGVQITSADGTPGAGFDIKVRGIGSVNGETAPLYVVDGFQVDNIDYLSNSDIESIEVLKDASASAIYGSRAANGVVLVTTKSGKKGAPTVTYNGSASYRTISRTLDLLSPYEFVQLQTEAWPQKFSTTYYNTGLDDNGVAYRYQSIDDYLNEGGVDWQNQAFRPTWSHDHNVSVTGGTDDTKYTFSFSDFIENGIFTNSAFNKITAKARINQKITDHITLDATFNYANTDKRGMGTSGDNGRFNMLAQILRARPTAGLRMTNEELLAASIDPLELEASESLSQVNPIRQAESVTDVTKSEMWAANVSLNINFTKRWSFKTAFSYNSTNIRRNIFYHEGSKEAYRNGQIPYGSNRVTRNVRWTNFNYLNYKYREKKNGIRHAFDLMLGQETSARSSEYVLAGATDFPFDNLGNNNLGLGATPSTADSDKYKSMLVSFFARANYTLMDRYLFTATVRADGSTVFSDKNKWGVFPSFSAAWKISEEPFMENVDVISNLKLRAGWGMVGNDRIENYLSMDLYSQGKYGYGNSLTTVLFPKHLANKDLKWEASQSTNIGIDYGMFRDRLNITLDLFQKDTKDLLMKTNKAYVSGFAEQMRNVGKIRNKGIELSVNSTNISTLDGFIWKTDFNISFIRNELLELADGATEMLAKSKWNNDYDIFDYMARVGEPLGLIRGYVFDGVYQYSDFDYNVNTNQYILKEGVVDMAEHNGPVGVAPGVSKYKDISGPDGVPDGRITTDDITVIGNGTPKWYGGITNSFAYKGVDFSFMFQFNYGNDIYNATRIFASQSQDERSNMMGDIADRWTPTNASNKVPKWNGYVKNEINSRFIEDGSFLRLKNLTLGYTFPKHWTRKIFVNRLRLYVSAQNLFVVTKYSGYDPEVSMRAANPMTPSLDWGAYPKSNVYIIGLDLSF